MNIMCLFKTITNGAMLHCWCLVSDRRPLSLYATGDYRNFMCILNNNNMTRDILSGSRLRRHYIKLLISK